MTLRGIVRGNTVEITDGTALPEGAVVTIGEVVIESPAETTPATGSDEEPADGHALNRALMKFAGNIDGLPADMSVKLDHYLYGAPKR